MFACFVVCWQRLVLRVGACAVSVCCLIARVIGGCCALALPVVGCWLCCCARSVLVVRSYLSIVLIVCDCVLLVVACSGL